MEAAVIDLEVERCHHSSTIHLPQESPKQHTDEYVKQHSESSDIVPTKENSKPVLFQNLQNDSEKRHSSPVYCVLSSWNGSQYSGSEKRQQCNPPFPNSSYSYSHLSKSPAASMHHHRRNTLITLIMMQPRMT